MMVPSKGLDNIHYAKQKIILQLGFWKILTGSDQHAVVQKGLCDGITTK